MKRLHAILAATVAASSLGLAAPAFASSDYLLQLDAADGKPATTIEVQSWSWGTSHPLAASAEIAAAARAVQPPATNGTLTIVSPRDVATGQASGKRTVIGCVRGTHFPTATLRGADKAWKLTHVMVSDCPADGLQVTYHKIEVENASAGRIGKSRSNIQNN